LKGIRDRHQFYLRSCFGSGIGGRVDPGDFCQGISQPACVAPGNQAFDLAVWDRQERGERSLTGRIRDNRHVDLDDKAVLDLTDREPVPVNQLLNKELNELIQRSLALLDDDKRVVFTLKVFQQCSYEEIAEITGFSIPKLKTDLHRARSEMRKRINPYVRFES